MSDAGIVALAYEEAMNPTPEEAATEVLAWAEAMAGRAGNGWNFTAAGPAPGFPRLRLRSLRVLAESVGGESDPAAEYGGDLAAPLCCCKRGLMCANCGTGRHFQCLDRDAPDCENRDGDE